MSAILGFTGFEVATNTSFLADPATVSVHTNPIKVNRYHQDIHKRNSLDDKGMGLGLVSTVHIGSKWNSAAWNGKQMLYGDGIVFSSLAGGMDVAGHEMTHGVISKTANLTYQDEPGAINESLADIFGALPEMYLNGSDSPGEWEMGEDMFNPNKPSDLCYFTTVSIS